MNVLLRKYRAKYQKKELTELKGAVSEEGIGWEETAYFSMYLLSCLVFKNFFYVYTEQK